MGEKTYTIQLDHQNKLYAYVKTVQGRVKAFVVKLLCEFEEDETEVLRYDSGHGTPHVDYLNEKGEVIEKRWLEYLSNDQALTTAIEDIKGNYQFYHERFTRWQKREKKKSRRKGKSAGRGKTLKHI